VAVIDVGSNTARLLVADVDGRRVTQARRERHYLRLGDDVHALGRIGSAKLDEAVRVARRYARLARKAGAERLETIVTAPGRQAANGVTLIEALAGATEASVVQLDGDDEGRLAWEGAVARMDDPPECVAVIDLGGGSCELAVGRPGAGTEWVRSIDAGSLRITRAHLGSQNPDAEQILEAGNAIRRLIGSIDPPRPDATVAVGGTARAIGRLLGPQFDGRQLDELVGVLRRVPTETIVDVHGVTPDRAETMIGGTLVLAELAFRLESPLEVGRGGLREGAALALARAARAAA
jgi:exopolyphosphatase/guanosine-5'-triphosphate,3'-diphosphate pyrophosphatase